MTDVINNKYADALSEHTILYKDIISCVINFIPTDLEIEYMKKETKIIDELSCYIDEWILIFNKYPDYIDKITRWEKCDGCTSFHNMKSTVTSIKDLRLPHTKNKKLDIILFNNIAKVIYDKYNLYIKLQRVDIMLDITISKNNVTEF